MLYIVLAKMTGSGINLASCVVVLSATKVVNLYELLARAYETVFYLASRALGNDYWDKYNNKNVYPDRIFLDLTEGDKQPFVLQVDGGKHVLLCNEHINAEHGEGVNGYVLYQADNLQAALCPRCERQLTDLPGVSSLDSDRSKFLQAQGSSFRLVLHVRNYTKTWEHDSLRRSDLLIELAKAIDTLHHIMLTVPAAELETLPFDQAVITNSSYPESVNIASVVVGKKTLYAGPQKRYIFESNGFMYCPDCKRTC